MVKSIAPIIYTNNDILRGTYLQYGLLSVTMSNKNKTNIEINTKISNFSKHFSKLFVGQVKFYKSIILIFFCL